VWIYLFNVIIYNEGCTNGGQSRRKRQFFVMEENMNLFWNMPLSYDFSDDEGSKLIK